MPHVKLGAYFPRFNDIIQNIFAKQSGPDLTKNPIRLLRFLKVPETLSDPSGIGIGIGDRARNELPIARSEHVWF